MTTRPTMPAVEYQNLWMRLVEMRQLDPERVELRNLQDAFMQIGLDAGIVERGVGHGAESDAPQLRATVDWDQAEIDLAPSASDLVDRVAQITNVPE